MQGEGEMELILRKNWWRRVQVSWRRMSRRRCTCLSLELLQDDLERQNKTRTKVNNIFCDNIRLKNYKHRKVGRVLKKMLNKRREQDLCNMR